MKRILLTFVLLASSVCAQADQLLYDADTGKRSIILKDDGSLWLKDAGGLGIWGYLEDDIIYDRKELHTIGYRKGNVLYGNNGHVLAYFKKH